MAKERTGGVEDPLEGIPWIAVGNDQLGDALKKTHMCPECHKRHAVQHSSCLSWVKCPKSLECYIIGMDGCEIIK